MSIYYIGGSPCSGKSTIAQELSARYGLHYFKADDYLEECITRGASEGLPVCQRIREMSADEIWMRPPLVQCREEMACYAEIAPYVMEKLIALPPPLIAEGAAFLPCLMHAQGVPAGHYIAIIPSAEFQVSRYIQRPWIPHALQGASNPDSAFANWMARDILFAAEVHQQCRSADYSCLITDGSIPPEARLAQAAAHFRLTAEVWQEYT